MTAAPESEIVPKDYRLSWEPMTAEQAEHATTQINTYLVRGPQLVKEAKDGKAYEALGYATWNEYVDDRLLISVQYANLLVRFAERLELLADAIDVDVALLAVPERVLRGIPAETMVSAAKDAVADLGDNADVDEKIAAADKAVREAGKAQQTASAAVTAAARRRCVEHLTANPILSVQELAKAAGASIEMAQDVWTELAETLAEAAAEREAEAFARGAATANAQIPAPDAGAPASPAPVSDPTPDVQADAPTAPSGEPEGTSTPPAQGSDPVDSSSADGDQTDDGGGAGAFPAHAPVVVHPTRPTIVPRSDDGSPSVADLLDWWPANGQWRTATAELGTEDSAFGRFMDLREPRDSEDPTELAKTCPAALRPGAAKAARIAAQHFIETAEALERPTPLTIVEEA